MSLMPNPLNRLPVKTLVMPPVLMQHQRLFGALPSPWSQWCNHLRGLWLMLVAMDRSLSLGRVPLKSPVLPSLRKSRNKLNRLPVKTLTLVMPPVLMQRPWIHR